LYRYTVVISILLFKNPVSSAGMIGYTITVLGVVFYSEVGPLYMLSPLQLTHNA
jgi:hypothetical protein